MPIFAPLPRSAEPELLDAPEHDLTALALHHFDPPAAAALLRELGRVARRGVIVNDLQRGQRAYWGARLLARHGTPRCPTLGAARLHAG